MPFGDWVLVNAEANNSAITWTGNSTIPSYWFHKPAISIELPLQGERTMGTIVEGVDQLAAAPAGTLVVVYLNDGAKRYWVADGKGNLAQKDASAPALPAREFRSAILNGTVHIIEPTKVGDTFVAGNRFARILAPAGDDWLIGRSGSRGGAATLESFVGQPEPDWRKTGDVGELVEAGFAVLVKLHEAEQTEARLKEILDHGEVPTNEDYHVAVLVHGSRGLLLTEEQVVEMLVGDLGDVTVTGINSFDVAYTREVTVRKRSRWGCACDQVTQNDVDTALAEVDGDWGKWEVVGCKPMGKGSKATAHKAA